MVYDYATRFPEAIALKSITAETIAEELIKLFAQMGIPEEILTDQGTNFTAELLKELYCLLHVKAICTSPYHPRTNGLVERFNGMLKNMLKKFLLRKARIGIGFFPICCLGTGRYPKHQQNSHPSNCCMAGQCGDH